MFKEDEVTFLIANTFQRLDIGFNCYYEKVKDKYDRIEKYKLINKENGSMIKGLVIHINSSYKNDLRDVYQVEGWNIKKVILLERCILEIKTRCILDNIMNSRFGKTKWEQFSDR